VTRRSGASNNRAHGHREERLGIVLAVHRDDDVGARRRGLGSVADDEHRPKSALEHRRPNRVQNRRRRRHVVVAGKTQDLVRVGGHLQEHGHGIGVDDHRLGDVGAARQQLGRVAHMVGQGRDLAVVGGHAHEGDARAGGARDHHRRLDGPGRELRAVERHDDPHRTHFSGHGTLMQLRRGLGCSRHRTAGPTRQNG
jgi:hypothetical protein